MIEEPADSPPSRLQVVRVRIAEHRGEVLAAGLILLIAIGVRIFYLLQYKAAVPYFYKVTLDSEYYDLWATRVAEGEGYGPMPFYMAPLYPYLLALFYKVFGHQFLPVYVLQAMLGVTNTLLVYLLARRLFSHAAGLIAMGLMTLYAPLLFLESKLLTEVLAITLNLGAILLLMSAVERPTLRRFLAAGLMIGVGGVCRPAALLMAVLFLPWYWIVTRRQKSMPSLPVMAAFLLGVILPIVPVTARNYLVAREFVPLSTNAGIVFAQGNNPAAKGISTPMPGFSAGILTQQQEEMQIAERTLGHPVTASESSRFWFKVGVQFIASRPGAYVKLLVMKIIWALHNRESPCSYNFYYERMLVPILRYLALPFPVLFGLALFGFLSVRRAKANEDNRSQIAALYVLSIFLSLVIFSVSSRYRAPMVPALALFAAVGLARIPDAVRNSGVRSIAAVIGCVALAYLPSLKTFEAPALSPEAPSNMGLAYMDLGRLDRAIQEFRRAIAIDPRYPFAYNNLGTALQEQGKLEEAKAAYMKALRMMPGDANTNYNLAQVLVLQGKDNEAIAYYRRSLAAVADRPDVHSNLANALLRTGQVYEAIDEYMEALRLDPGFADARNNLPIALKIREQVERSGSRDTVMGQVAFHYNTGNARLKDGDPEGAIVEYRKAIRLKPDLGQAYHNMAVALFQTGRYAEAWDAVHLAEKHNAPPRPEFRRQLATQMPEPRVND